MMKEIPEPWAGALERAKLTDPRNGRPSMRALAVAVGAHTSTISDMVHGRRDTSIQTIEQVAVALGVEASTVSKWAGDSRQTIEPYTPPAESSYLTARQRKAVDELIRAMTVKAGESGATSTSPITHAGDDADEVTQANRGRLEHGQQPVPNLDAIRRRQEQADTTPPEVIETMAADRERDAGDKDGPASGEESREKETER